jgi:hypothetical protein
MFKFDTTAENIVMGECEQMCKNFSQTEWNPKYIFYLV